MDKDSITKTYSNGEITVIWKSGICKHSGICARSLPGVFQPKSKPWIKMDQAQSEEIIRTVERCPSGAISIKTTNQST